MKKVQGHKKLFLIIATTFIAFSSLGANGLDKKLKSSNTYAGSKTKMANVANRIPYTNSEIVRTRKKVNILQAYQDALHNDPIFQEQLASYMSSKEASAQAVSTILPQLQLIGNLQGTRENGIISGVDKFNSSNWGARVTQTLFNWGAFSDLSRAKYSVQASALLLSANQQNLILRLAQAYLNVLEAQDTLKYTQLQNNFLKRTLRATEQRYKKKYATITDVDIARGSFQTVNSQLITAKINLHNSIQNLSQITGVRYVKFADFQNNQFPLVSPQPLSVNKWVEKARWDNLALRAARMNLKAAKSNISVVGGGFLPTINGVLTWNKIYGFSEEPDGNGNQVRQTTRERTIGLSATWNLFSGGLTVSQLREARANYQQAMAQMRQQYLNAVVSARNAFVSVQKGVVQVRRSLSAMRANEDAVKHSDQAYRAGTLTIFDVLEAQSRLFASQRQFTSDLYAYILNNLLLEQAAGVLSPANLMQINHWLYPKFVF